MRQARVRARISTERERDLRLRRLYGITLRQYRKMLKRQKGVCAVCGKPPKKVSLNVDHDHETDRVRGLLCFFCNKKIVGRHHNGKLLRAAADWVDSDFDGRHI